MAEILMAGNKTPDSLALIAGKGAYPLLLARSAKQQGVRRVVAIAFRHETEAAIEKCADEVKWLHLGQLQALLDAVKATGIKNAVMAGQLTPTALFHVRLDALARPRSAGSRSATLRQFSGPSPSCSSRTA